MGIVKLVEPRIGRTMILCQRNIKRNFQSVLGATLAYCLSNIDRLMCCGGMSKSLNVQFLGCPWPYFFPIKYSIPASMLVARSSLWWSSTPINSSIEVTFNNANSSKNINNLMHPICSKSGFHNINSLIMGFNHHGMREVMHRYSPFHKSYVEYFTVRLPEELTSIKFFWAFGLSVRN